jgi:hypothetical protein
LIEEQTAQNQCWQAQPRNLIASGDARVTVLANEQQNLGAVDKEKLHQKVQESLTNKFSMMKMLDQEGQLDMTYNLMLRIEELEARLCLYNMFEVFMVQLFDPANPNMPVNQCNLLSFYATTTYDEVIKSVCFLHRYGQDYNLKNLQWSQELLENSCEQNLCDKVMEQMITLPCYEHGGLTFFYLMVMTITSLTEEGARALTIKIWMMMLTKYDGENITVAVSMLRGTLLGCQWSISCLQTCIFS